jgi:hypothetical protein
LSSLKRKVKMMKNEMSAWGRICDVYGRNSAGEVVRTHVRLMTTGYVTEDGDPLDETAEITPEWLMHHFGQLRRRCDKPKAEQRARTKRRAEVFTPTSVVAFMNDHAEAAKCNVPVEELDTVSWRDRIQLRALDSCCGEGAFTTTLYDPITGEDIPEPERVGILDRKLRLVVEHAPMSLAPRYLLTALRTSYACDIMGDNVILARMNVYLAWLEAYRRAMGTPPSIAEMNEACEVICGTVMQVDALTGMLPASDLRAVIPVYDHDTLTWEVWPEDERPKTKRRRTRRSTRRATKVGVPE